MKKLLEALKGITTEQLQAELARREQEENKPPTPLEKPDWEKFRRFLEESVAEWAKPDGYLKDWSHYVFEEALTTLYGKNFWDWWNEGPANRC